MEFSSKAIQPGYNQVWMGVNYFNTDHNSLKCI